MSQPIVKKFLGTAGVQIFASSLSMLMGIVLARLLGPEEFGRYSFILSLIAIAVIPTIAGMPQLIIREVANAQLDKRWGELKGILRWAIGYIVSISIVVILGLICAIELKWITSDIGNLLWVGLLLVPIRGLLSRQNALLNGLRHPVLAQLPQSVLISILALSIVGFLYLSGKRLDAYILLQVQVISGLISLVISIYFIFLKTPKEVLCSSAEYKVKQWHKTLLPFSLLTIIGTMNNELASIFLGFYGMESSIAYFKVAMQGVAILALGQTAVNAISAPNIARQYKAGDMNGVQNTISQSVQLSALFSIPICLVLIFFGERIIDVLFGSDYSQASGLLTILCLGYIVNVLSGSVGLILQMTGNEKRSLLALIFSFILGLVLLIILIPKYQEYGAAISVSISMIVWNVIMAIQVYKITNLRPWLTVKIYR
ncbi:oligosaccharide flippase family protein [Vibrio diabolicus]|uniref:oligosaccharide flippase family protein n=1 Tax=Vibrio diabolicus TaxID=50719 RepID=UPI002495979D|nr:oligosaccharide flippase family protein [Vibrio diabolicus]